MIFRYVESARQIEEEAEEESHEIPRKKWDDVLQNNHCMLRLTTMACRRERLETREREPGHAVRIWMKIPLECVIVSYILLNLPSAFLPNST